MVVIYKKYLRKSERVYVKEEIFKQILKLFKAQEHFGLGFDKNKGWKIKGKPVGRESSIEFSSVYSWLFDNK